MVLPVSSTALLAPLRMVQLVKIALAPLLLVICTAIGFVPWLACKLALATTRPIRLSRLLTRMATLLFSTSRS